MTRSRHIDDRIVEARRSTWLAPRRVVACAAIGVTIAAGAFVVDSLRRSAAQLGAAIPAAVQQDAPATPVTPTSVARPVSARAEPRMPPIEAAVPSEPVVSFESEPSEQFAPPGPLTGAEFAELVESGALGDVGADAEAIAEMRRALDAAAFEAELEPSEP
jgi:hypothetical protein